MPTPVPFFDAQQRRIYPVIAGFQFVIVVEASPGLSGAQVGRSLDPVFSSNRPDLQVQSTRDLGTGAGTGSLEVCDTGPASQGGGGVPGINPPDFGPDPPPPTPSISNALRDFACRFQVFNTNQVGPCTKVDPSQEARLITPNAPPSTVQFCDQVSSVAAFPPGDTILSVRVRDVEGNLGPLKQIVVRVATPTPKP